ncbi:MAG TPA: hypothetical protein VFQ53_33985 [Kofleriaceae bacterium]|nr:hypothetical protein [Kofleriaceae bacterium]
MLRGPRFVVPIAAIAAIAACSSHEPPAPAPQPAPPPIVADAGVTQIPGYDPASGMHLDEDGAGMVVAKRPKNRPSRPVDIMLKSSPPGAMAAVDGVQIGTTPRYWYGESDGLEHEFTFVLRGHAVARYRFVPLQSGVVHARLEAIAEEALDGGLEPQIAPTLAPDAAVVAPPPPPTVLTPVPAVDAGAATVPDAATVTPPLRPGAGPQP